jgi:SAM-dependent methyltransferase
MEASVADRREGYLPPMPRPAPKSDPAPRAPARERAQSPGPTEDRVGGGFYDEPAIYDMVYWPGTSEEVTGLERLARRTLGTRWTGPWLEPACGTGRCVRVVARRGRVSSIAGFDLAPRMLAFAQAKVDAMPRAAGERARLFVADMTGFGAAYRSLGLAPAVFAFNLHNTIRHLDSDRAMLAHLREMSACMEPGAVYAVGMGLARYGVEGVTEDVWTGGRGSTRVTQVCQYLPPFAAEGKAGRTERVISHITVSREGEPDQHHDATYPLRAYSLEQWTAIVRESPFELAGLADSEGREMGPVQHAYAVFVLRNRG